jgi:hypothetical protein
MVVAGTDWAGSCRKTGKHFAGRGIRIGMRQKQNGAGSIPRRLQSLTNGSRN